MEIRRDIATYLIQEFPKIYSGKQRANGSIIVKLNKALYGLREAGKLWNENLASLLIEEGYTRSTLDQGLFYINNVEQKTIINTHVDDLLVTTTSQAKIDMLRKRMSSRYGEMKRQTTSIDRPTISYVGSELVVEEGQIKVTQTRYTEQNNAFVNLNCGTSRLISPPHHMQQEQARQSTSCLWTRQTIPCQNQHTCHTS
jgi:hypothetical protein